MAITLGAITLSEHLQVPDWPSAVAAAGSERPTLGGRLVVQRTAVSAPQLLTLTAILEGGSLYGFFTRAQVEAVRLLAESGAEVDFVFHAATVRVVVALAGIDVRAIDNRTDPPATWPYHGTIQLIKVR